METLTQQLATRELRQHLSEVIGRACYGGERIGITRNGKLAAAIISLDDLRALEALEMQRDIELYRQAKAADDGRRISLEELRAQVSNT